MRKILRNFLTFLLVILIASWQKPVNQGEKPNVLLIMVDDLGIEGFSAYGSTITMPNIDKLAQQHGLRVSHCFAQPNCTPSRTKLMTGMRTYKSYDRWAYLNPKHKTIGNLMQEAGYRTAIAGKWQLNGNPKMSGYVESHNHAKRAPEAGFGSYHLQNYVGEEGPRYADSGVDHNGKRITGDYGPDMHRDFIIDFIGQNKHIPFFIYYPMVLVHAPYTMTPDSEDWGEQTPNRPRENYLTEMVEYTDKIIGQLVDALKQEGVYNNTVIIFTSDNGTGRSSSIATTDRGIVRGGKGTMTDAGTLVPLIIHYPKKIDGSFEWKGMIDFSDFYPTLASIAGSDIRKEKHLDGTSFLPLIEGKASEFKSKELVFMHHDPRRDDNAKRIKTDSTNRNRFVRTISYKLYQTGQFYNVEQDALEQNPLNLDSLNEKELEIHQQLRAKLDEVNRKYPWQAIWPPLDK